MGQLRLKKRNKVWEYSFEIAKIDGKRKSISKSGFRTKAEAAKAGVLAKAEYDQTGIKYVPTELSFNDFLNIWISDYCEMNLKYSTTIGYNKKINIHIRPELGIYKLSTLNPTMLQEFINNKAKAGYSRNTLSVIKGILSKSLHYAVQKNYIRYSPMVDVYLPNPRSELYKPRQSPHVYIPEDKIKMIFDRFPETTSAHIPMMLGYKGGLRLGEAFALTWSDIDFDKNTLSINRQIQWNEKDKCWYFSNPKYDSYRTIDIDKSFMELLSRALFSQKRAMEYYGDNYIYLYVDKNRVLNTERKGEKIYLVNVRANGTLISPRTMQYVSSVIHHKLNYSEFDFHSFRHTHATMLAENGVPMKYLQERLGHKNLQVTMKYYLHLTDKMTIEGISIINKLYQK